MGKIFSKAIIDDNSYNNGENDEGNDEGNYDFLNDSNIDGVEDNIRKYDSKNYNSEQYNKIQFEFEKKYGFYHKRTGYDDREFDAIMAKWQEWQNGQKQE